MKKFTPIMLAMAFAACHKQAQEEEIVPLKPATPQAVEKEPNNDSKSAQTISDTADLRGSFEPGDHPDEDWYRLAPAEPSIVYVEFSGVAGTDAAMEIYDSEKNKVAHASGGAGEPIILPDMGCQKQCFLRLVAGKKDVRGEYTLHVKFNAPTPRSEKEPNNRYVDAQPIVVGSATDGYIAPADDEDWYLVTSAGLPVGQMLSVSLSSPPDLRLELAVVRHSDQAPLGTYRAADLGEDIQMPDLAVPAAPETGVYLVVRSAWISGAGGKAKRVGNAKTAYTLEVKAVAAPANIEVEPNEDAAHATALDLGKPTSAGELVATRQGFLAPKGDTDWYAFHLDKPSILRAEVSGVEQVKFSLSLIDPAKKGEEKDNELAKSDSADVKEPEVLAGIAAPAGDNFLRVEGAMKKIDKKWVRDYANSSAPYTLTVTIDPDDGSWEREPNDKPDLATPVEVGHDYKGYIHPAGDVDYWKLELKDATNVAIGITAVPKLDLKIIVRDANRKGDDGEPAVIGSIDKNRVEGEERLVVPFEPGTYLIEIREKGKESNAQKPYVLSLK